MTPPPITLHEEKRPLFGPGNFAHLPDEVGPLVHYRETVIPSRGAVLKLGAAALARSVVNISVGVFDALGPLDYGAGDIASWTLDIMKYLKQAKGMKLFDSTPDVDWHIAVKTEWLELLGGVVPTHLIEGGLQLKYDIPRIGRALGVLCGMKPRAHWGDKPKVKHRPRSWRH